MSIHRFSFPTAIHFGAGARRLVPEHLRDAGVRRPLIVTDRGIGGLPMLAELRDQLATGFEVATFAGVFGNPTASQVAQGAALARSHGADGIVGLGGGAALDVAKAVALMAGHPGDILEYAWDHPTVRPIDRDLPWFVALPTTAGTGSEVGRSAVIGDDASHVKKIVFSPRLLAKAVFADPELTLGLPPAVTAATGMDALTHNVESYLSPAYHPLCDGIAVEGVRITARALRKAVANGHDVAARADMLMASMMGAVAFQKDLGAVHSCAHALGTVADLHHGLANGIMIDHVLPFNLPSCMAKLADLAYAVGITDGTPERRSAAFIDWVRQLKRDIGIPADLSGRVTRAQIPALIDIAIADTCHQTNPRPCTRDDFEHLFWAAIPA